MQYFKIFLVIFSLFFCFLLNSENKPDYKSKVSQINKLLNESIKEYKNNNIEKSVVLVEKAYFEIFENLEGPIRVNVSAKKSFELEEVFGDLRKLYSAGVTLAVIEERINFLNTELTKILPEIESGFVIKAQKENSNDEKSDINSKDSHENKAAKEWDKAYLNIEKHLNEALKSLKKGDLEEAKNFCFKAKFDGYKNSGLEIAFRTSISQSSDFVNNNNFSLLVILIDERLQNGQDKILKFEEQCNMTLALIKENLPNLSAKSEFYQANNSSSSKLEKDWSGVVANLKSEIDKAVDYYNSGEYDTAQNTVKNTYFDIFEASGMEREIGVKKTELKVSIEGGFTNLVSFMKKPESVEVKTVELEKINNEKTKLFQKLEGSLSLINKNKESLLSSFFYSLIIILREGFEALLIIMAIISYLIKTGNKEKVKVIYNGCVTALGASLVTAFFVNWIFKINAANQEIIEGITMLIATVVLVSASYWLISKLEAKKWKNFIQSKIDKSLTTGSISLLWITVFLAVYREGAETVLFYQALISNGTSKEILIILGGLILGSGILVALFFILRFTTVKLPLKPFFLITGFLLYYMAFVFSGKGVMELIEGRVIKATVISGFPSISILGVFPYLQTLIPQLVLVLAALVGLLAFMKNKQIES